MSVGYDAYYKESIHVGGTWYILQRKYTCRWDMVHITKKAYMSVGYDAYYKESIHVGGI